MAEKLLIELDLETGDVTKATKSLEKAGGKAGQKAASKFKERFNTGLGNVFGSIAKKAAVLTSAIGGIGSALVGIQSIRAAQTQEDAINALNSALFLSKNASVEASQGFQQFASELQQVTRFGDEALLQNAALIQSLGDLDAQGLQRATRAAADLATALRVDLGTAATLVGKAAAGEVGSFSRYGLSIKKAGSNAETFARALDAIEQKFGGAAQRDIVTFSGATDQLSNSFGDLLEEIGFIVTKNPEFISAIKSVNMIIIEATKQVSNFAKNFNAFDFITNKLVQFNEGFITYVVAPFELLINVAKLAFNSISTIFSFYVASYAKIASVVTGFLSKFGVGEKLAQDLKIFSEASSETLAELAGDTKKSFEDVFDFSVSDKLATKNEELRQFFNEQKMIAEQASASQNAIVETTTQTATASLINLKGIFSEVGSAFQTQAQTVAASTEQINAKVSKFAKESGVQLRTGLAQGAGQAFAEFGKALVTGENALQAFTNSLLKSIGQQAIALGTRFILEGAAYAFVPGYQALSAPLISAGAALAAFGGALGAAVGGGETGGGGGGAVSGSEQAFANTNEELATPEDTEERIAGTSVNLVVQGSLVQQEEIGEYLVNTLNENFEKKGLTLTDARFA